MNSKKNFIAFFSGLLFATGLGISGMTQPQKVIAFLDLVGTWDPSLMFVMGGALMVHFISYRIIKKWRRPIVEESWHIPTTTKITKPLIFGSLLFGIGWGLSGFCPGPAIVSLGTGSLKAIIMVCAINLGIGLGTMGENNG